MSSTSGQAAAATPAAHRIDEFVLTHRAGHTEYRLWLQRTGHPGSGQRWHVGFAYGRMGTRLREGCKTRVPVTCLEAKGIIEGIVDAKLRKGYVLAIPAPRSVIEPAAGVAHGGWTALPAPPMFTVNREGRRVLEF